MPHPLSLLDNLSIASPCKASWEEMTGNDRARLCHLCKQNVYNVSRMTAEEVESLLANAAQGRDSACIRLYRRRDGKVLTKDCPEGLAARRCALILRTFAATCLTFFVWCLAMPDVQGGRSAAADRLRQVEPFASILNWLDPPPQYIGKPMVPRQ